MDQAIGGYFSVLRRNRLLSVVFLINIISTNTIIPSIVGVPEDIIQFVLLVMINAVCIIKLSGEKTVNREKNNVLFKLLLAVLLFEVIKSPVVDTSYVSRGAYSLLILLMMGSFMFFLNLSIKKRGNEVLQAFIFTYVLFCFFVIITTIIAYLLVFFDVINLGSPFNSYLFESNERAGSVYYFPGHLSIIQTPEIRIPFVQKYGLFCGLFHEPHVANYYLAPGVFFSFYFVEGKLKRFIILLLYLVFVLASFSTTNILVLLIILFLYIIKGGSPTKIIISALLLLIIVFYSSETILAYQVMEEVGFKLNDVDSGSMEYSTDRLRFLLQPASLFGSTLYTTAISPKTDVGIIPFLLNILFVTVLFLKGIILYFKSKSSSKEFFLALGCIYFILHSMKTNALNYQYTYLVFIAWVIVYFTPLSWNKKKKHESN